MAFSALLAILLISCGDGINLENRDNEFIPNYSLTIANNEVVSNMQSGIIAIEDDTFIMAVESVNNTIQLVEISQEFSDQEWNLNFSNVFSVGTGHLSFFDSLANEYLVGYTQSDGTMVLQLIDDDFNLTTTNNNLEAFIDAFYNDIDSVLLSSFTYVQESDEILLGGKVYTQGTTFSCILNLDRQLNPIWIKTYFENSNIVDVVSINRDTFYLINNSPEGADLIRDNENSLVYSKYDLSNDQLFFGKQSFIDHQRLFLIGIHNDIGRTIEVDINSASAFINEIEIYPVTDLNAVFLSRDNIVTAGIKKENGNDHQFSSELGEFGSIWCHRYVDETYHKILDILEMPGKGILISSIVNQEGSFFIHLTRIDEEGATFVNEYTENCI